MTDDIWHELITAKQTENKKRQNKTKFFTWNMKNDPKLLATTKKKNERK